MPVLVKGSHVRLEMADGDMISVKASHGIIHDPSGADLPRCEVYVGPFKKVRVKNPVKMSSAERAYFGSSYTARAVAVTIPGGDWRPIGECVQIFYKRPASNRPNARHPGKYFHPMKVPVPVSKCGSFYRLEMPDGCRLNDRGFIWP